MMKKITRRSFLSICGAAAAAAALTACGGAASSTAASSAAASSTAASASSTAALSGNVATGGSTSMKNVIAALTEGFAELEPDVTISYDPTGSGAGITGATDKTLDIGLSSRALKADETGLLICGHCRMLPKFGHIQAGTESAPVENRQVDGGGEGPSAVAAGKQAAQFGTAGTNSAGKADAGEEGGAGGADIGVGLAQVVLGGADVGAVVHYIRYQSGRQTLNAELAVQRLGGR